MEFFLNRFEELAGLPALIHKDETINYRSLLRKIYEAKDYITNERIEPGEVVALIGDFTPNTISLLFALIINKNIIVPFVDSASDADSRKYQIANIQKSIKVDINTDAFNSLPQQFEGNHPFYETIRRESVPGLVLFTSGTSGEPKGAVHNFSKLLKKFEIKRKAIRTINFLLFDHWGGLNTMFHTLSNGGVVLALNDRKPKAICEFIEKHQIELLPASPTFLNLLLLSEEYKNYDLSSLKLITYGTEPMPESTLQRIKTVFPKVRLQQTYGLIELGVLRSKSKDDNSLWVKVGGEGFETRVVDGLLEIRAESAMLGYLNAPSPFTEDGWFMTGDQVEVDGEYIKILGRKSEIINVGGEKVYPAEVESVIQEMDNVAEVTVFSERNTIIGNIVCAKIRLKNPEDKKAFTVRLKSYCKNRLQSFKIPVKVSLVEEEQFSDRFKKIRKISEESTTTTKGGGMNKKNHL